MIAPGPVSRRAEDSDAATVTSLPQSDPDARSAGDTRPAADRRSADRRSADRTTTLYRPVLVETDDITGFCLLRNISAEGMMGRFFTEFAANTPVAVQFTPELSVRGKVSWSRDGMIGIQFATPVDVSAILAALSSGPVRGRNQRGPRLQIQADIEIELDGRRLRTEIQDISQKGLKVRTSFLRPDDEVTVLLDGLAPKKAVVRWTQAHLAGLNFVQPIAFDRLGEWVVRQHVSDAPDSTETAATQAAATDFDDTMPEGEAQAFSATPAGEHP